MAYLTVVSEKMSSFPHLCCVFEYGTRLKWLGFEPGPNAWLAGAIGPGHLDDSSRQTYVGYYARFRVGSGTNRLWLAEGWIRTNYADNSGYQLYRRDCVSCVIDACRQCNLRVPPTPISNPLLPKMPLPGTMPIVTNPVPNLMPHEVIWKLRILNLTELTHFGTDRDTPYPWL